MEDLKTRFEQDLFARHAGIVLTEIKEGFARAQMRIQPEHLNSLGGVHGGAIFTLADLAFAAAANSHGHMAVAINVNISYLKAVRQGILYAEAQEISRNPKLASCTVNVRDEAGDLVAVFQGMSYAKKEPMPPISGKKTPGNPEDYLADQ